MEEIDSATSLHYFTKAHTNTLICFSATWCGPCKASKPALEQLAANYSADPTMDVTFGIIYEHALGESIHEYGVRAFPTYILFTHNGDKEFDRVQGANLEAIQAMIAKAGCKANYGDGHQLGGSGNVLSAEEARMQRLAALEKKMSPDSVDGTVAAVTTTSTDTTTTTTTIDTTVAIHEEKDVTMEDVVTHEDTEMKAEESNEASTEGETDEMVDPTANLSKECITTLTESMGFSLIRAQKGLLNGNGTTEGAVEWLMEHQDDDDIDDPISMVPKTTPIAQSYKCNECGKILSNMANLELHANKTGHSDFEECTEQVKPLTEEEKAAKIAEIKQLLQSKREEREELEKIEEINREKNRREMGKNIIKTKEEMEKLERQRQIQLKKKEKEDFKKERARIRAELEKDKAERRANAGKMTSKLGVEGYHPDGIQYDVNAGNEEDGNSDAHQKKKIKASAAKIDEYIEKVSSYRAGGDGQKCLKILIAYISNVIDNPDDDKYKSIKTDNKIYKAKVKPFIGAKALLLAVGFSENNEKTLLVLSDDADFEVLKSTHDKLEKAYNSY